MEFSSLTPEAQAASIGAAAGVCGGLLALIGSGIGNIVAYYRVRSERREEMRDALAKRHQQAQLAALLELQDRAEAFFNSFDACWTELRVQLKSKGRQTEPISDAMHTQWHHDAMAFHKASTRVEDESLRLRAAALRREAFGLLLSSGAAEADNLYGKVSLMCGELIVSAGQGLRALNPT